MRRRGGVGVGIAVLAGVAGVAQADPLDTFGFGARAAGLAGAVTADTTGAAAAHANPAGVALAEHPEVLLGWGYGSLDLSIDGRNADVLDVHGSDVGLAIPANLGRLRVGVGVALHLPDQFLARIQLIPATEPHFVLLDNDIHRIVIEPVVSLRLTPWFSIGGGVALLADAAGNGVTFDVGVVGGDKVGESGVDVTLPTKATPLVGILVTPHPRVRFGATYRGQVDLALKLDILANVDVAGVVSGDVLIGVRAANYFTPHRVVFGAAVDLAEGLTLTGEVAWFDWSAFEGGSPDVRILIALGINPPLVDTLFPSDGFRDTFVPRAGLEWRTALARTDVIFRGGYSFEPTPVPQQTGLTSFADNDRHVAALGAGVVLRAFEPILTRPLAIDVAAQWHHLRDRLTVKDQATFPGEAFASSGEIFRATTSLKVAF